MVKHPPDVLITTPESLYLMLTSGARAIFEGTETVILDEIHAVAQTKRGAHLAITLERLVEQAGRDVQRVGLSATQNPLEEVGPVHGRAQAQGHDRGHGHAQAAGPEDPRAGGVDGRAGDAGPGPGPVRGPGGHAQVDLARDLPRAAQARQRAHLHADLRQQPARRRAAGAAAERDRRGADRPRAPRLARPRGAADRRGDAQGRRAAVPGGDVVAGAGHRHGRRGPRAAGRVAEVRHRRAAADRPRRPQRRRHVQGPHLPEVPRGSARVRGGRAAHARGQDRDDGRPAQPAGRARAADRGDGGHRRGHAAAGGPAGGDARPHLHVLGADVASSSRTCWTCSTAATRARSSGSCGRGSSGTA